jgi:hypothetical protein
MISDVYDSVVQVFCTYGCPAPVYLGQQYADQHLAPLSVVMWQTDDQFSGQNASVPVGPDTPTGRLYLNPRPLKTRRCGVTARLWAQAKPQRSAQDQYRADLAYLDALINQYCIALNYITAGINEIKGGMAAKGNAAAGVAGLGYDLFTSIDIPIVDAKWPAEALDKCTETWVHQTATAVISVAAEIGDPPFAPNVVFPVPTP